MNVNFQATFTAECDIEEAFNDFETLMEWHKDLDPHKAVYDAIEENLICFPKESAEYLPQEVIEKFADALRKRIGGVQMEMDLPPFPTLWWEDSVWKK